MQSQWQSKKLYEHPAKHQTGTVGKIDLSGAGVYVLRVGGSYMSCPQDWAAKIHAEELAGQSNTYEALKHLNEAIKLMEESKSAFQSATIANARAEAEKAREILQGMI